MPTHDPLLVGALTGAEVAGAGDPPVTGAGVMGAVDPPATGAGLTGAGDSPGEEATGALLGPGVVTGTSTGVVAMLQASAGQAERAGKSSLISALSSHVK